MPRRQNATKIGKTIWKDVEKGKWKNKGTKINPVLFEKSGDAMVLHVPAGRSCLSKLDTSSHARLGTRSEPDFRSEPPKIWSLERPPHALFKQCEASLPLMKTVGLAPCVKPLCQSWRHWALSHCVMHKSLDREGGTGFNPRLDFFSIFYNGQSMENIVLNCFVQ